MTQFCRQNATSIAQAVNSRKTSAIAVVEDVIARLAAYDAIQPQIWINRASDADLRAAAGAIDARLAAGDFLFDQRARQP